MRDEPKPGYGAQLRANLEPTKGVGRLRQQDGGHGSRTAKECVTTHLPNQLAPKWMALKRDLYPPPGKSQASMIDPKSRGNSPDSALCANFKGDPLKFRTGRAVDGNGPAAGRAPHAAWCPCIPAPLKTEDRKPPRPVAFHNRIRSPRIGSRAGLGVPVQPADCWRLLEPLTWRATASCRPGTDWERSFELSRAEQPTQNCALNVKVKKFNQARFPLSLSTIQLNHSQGNGLGRISGKEDPVELDSNELNENRNLVVEQKGKSSLDSDFQYEYEPDNWLVAAKPLIATLLFDPSILTDEMQPSCAQVSPKHPDGALTPERAAHSCVHGHYCRKDLIEPASVKLETIMDHYCPKTVHGRANVLICVLTDSPRGQKSPKQSTLTFHQYTLFIDGQSSWLKSPNSPRKGQRVDMCTDAKITHDILRGLKSPTDSPRKGQRVDMRIDDSPRGLKSPTDSPRRRKITHDSPRGLKSPTDSPRKGQRVDMRIDGQSSWAKITRQSTEGPTFHGRANALICASTDSPRGLKSPDSPRKGQRVDMRIDDSPRGRKSPTTVLEAKITHDSPRGLKSPTDSPRKGQRVDMRIDDSPRGENHPRQSSHRGLKSPDSPRKGQRVDMRIDDSPRGRKSPDSPRKGQRVDMRIDDSPRGENHPRQSSWA
ncbi:hypothetical protein Bca101_102064 [Brassica carinata]